MKTEWLEYLIDFEKYNSLNKVAEIHFVTSQNVGKMLRNLEQEIGVPLFEQKGRTLVLTEDGKIFSSIAKSIIYMIDDFKAKYYSTTDIFKGNIELIGNDLSIVSKVLEPLSSRYPDVTISVYEIGFVNALEYIERKPQTLAILPLPQKEEHKKLIMGKYYDIYNCIPLCEDITGCFVSKNSSYTFSKPINLSDLKNEKIAMLRKGFAKEDENTDFFVAKLKKKINPKYELIKTNSPEYFFSGINKGHFIGVASMNDYINSSSSYKKDIVPLTIRDVEKSSQNLIYYGAKKHFSDVEKVFIKMIEEYYSYK